MIFVQIHIFCDFGDNFAQRFIFLQEFKYFPAKGIDKMFFMCYDIITVTMKIICKGAGIWLIRKRY